MINSAKQSLKRREELVTKRTDNAFTHSLRNANRKDKDTNEKG